MSETLRVSINGVGHEVQAGLTVAALIVSLGLDTNRVAVERNLQILPRVQWEATGVEPEDRYEIVHFVGGG